MRSSDREAAQPCSKMLTSLIILILVMGALVFAAAGTFDYWQSWTFLACYFAASLIMSM
jgi:uncharacterized membrane protein